MSDNIYIRCCGGSAICCEVNHERPAKNAKTERQATPAAALGLLDGSAAHSASVAPVPAGVGLIPFVSPEIVPVVLRVSLNQSAAARSGLFSGSGATAKAMQDRGQQIASDEWGKAYERGADTRNFKASQYLNKFKSIKDNEAETRSRLGDLLKQSGSARSDMFSAKGGKADLGMGTDRALADLAAGRDRNNGAFTQSMWDTAGNVAGSLGQGASVNFGKKGDSDDLAQLIAAIKGSR